MENKIIHNNTTTILNGMTSEELEAYYNEHPFEYYQAYVAGSIAPYYDYKLACIGASEELMEFLTAKDDEILSEAGDFLFQLNNIANFRNINIADLGLYYESYTTLSLQRIFGELLGTFMKEARYPDHTYFENKYGMTLEERISEKLKDTLSALNFILHSKYGYSLKDVMDYNLHKLDERHSSDGVYRFGSGYANTRADGGTANR